MAESLLISLKSLLTALSYGLLIGCLLQVIFNYNKIEKSFNVIALAFIVSLSVVFITLESLEARILFGFTIMISTIVILAKEMKKNSEDDKS